MISYSVDGGENWYVAKKGIRISVDVPDEDENKQLSFNFTSEGLISDVWIGNDQVATDSQMYVEF